MEHLPESRTRSYFTTARVIQEIMFKPGAVPDSSKDWLWINAQSYSEFDTEDEAQSLANQANENGREISGIDTENYPFFVVKVTQTSVIEKVK